MTPATTRPQREWGKAAPATGGIYPAIESAEAQNGVLPGFSQRCHNGPGQIARAIRRRCDHSQKDSIRQDCKLIDRPTEKLPCRDLIDLTPVGSARDDVDLIGRCNTHDPSEDAIPDVGVVIIINIQGGREPCLGRTITDPEGIAGCSTIKTISNEKRVSTGNRPQMITSDRHSLNPAKIGIRRDEDTPLQWQHRYGASIASAFRFRGAGSTANQTRGQPYRMPGSDLHDELPVSEHGSGSRAADVDCCSRMMGQQPRNGFVLHAGFDRVPSG